jgi:hypothetical protein
MGKRWTKKEELQLMTWRAEKVSVEEVAKRLDRSKCSVYSRAYIIKNRPNKVEPIISPTASNVIFYSLMASLAVVIILIALEM